MAFLCEIVQYFWRMYFNQSFWSFRSMIHSVEGSMLIAIRANQPHQSSSSRRVQRKLEPAADQPVLVHAGTRTGDHVRAGAGLLRLLLVRQQRGAAVQLATLPAAAGKGQRFGSRPATQAAGSGTSRRDSGDSEVGAVRRRRDSRASVEKL